MSCSFYLFNIIRTLIATNSGQTPHFKFPAPKHIKLEIWLRIIFYIIRATLKVTSLKVSSAHIIIETMIKAS